MPRLLACGTRLYWILTQHGSIYLKICPYIQKRKKIEQNITNQFKTAEYGVFQQHLWCAIMSNRCAGVRERDTLVHWCAVCTNAIQYFGYISKWQSPVSYDNIDWPRMDLNHRKIIFWLKIWFLYIYMVMMASEIHLYCPQSWHSNGLQKVYQQNISGVQVPYSAKVWLTILLLLLYMQQLLQLDCLCNLQYLMQNIPSYYLHIITRKCCNFCVSVINMLEALT